ncbi:Gfo/Idh/MocA family oxidoreductase [Candidatus Sumerlaeota bacterium]|nr:Gfo/Idh/MocA family oxidoreductase [Candidatus Sumerlaeota bacterium]
MTENPLRIGVIGCGYWGPNLIRNFNALAEAEVAWVCDLNADRLSHIVGLYPHVVATENHRDIMGDASIEAVAIATPVPSHFALAKEALEAGKHVFVEKPMCETSAEAEELIALAKARGLTLFVGHTFIYSPAVQEIARIVRSGELGKIYYVASRRLNLGLLQRDINVIQDLAPHDISILNHILDQDPIAVSASGSAHHQEGVEDVATMTVEYAGKLQAFLHSSWLDPKKVREMVFVGEEKMLVYDDVEPQEKIRIHDKRVVRPPHYDTFAEFQFSYHYGDVHTPWLRGGEPLRTECKHFIDCIRSGETPLSSGEHGLRVIRVLEAANASMRNCGARVELPPLCESTRS